MEATAMNPTAPAVSRTTQSPMVLLVQAIGGPRAWAGKLSRLFRTILIIINRKEIRRRLERLQTLGFMETIPSNAQLTIGGLDMLRFFIEPGARSYYKTRNINFAFHQVLRVLDDPVSMIDPIGILSDRDTIIGHILQVVHGNPTYDLQILDMFEDGLDELESQTKAIIDGTHPRSKTIGAIIEDPDYHKNLLDYIKQYRKNPAAPELRRDTGDARQNFLFLLAEETFGTLPGFMQYANTLPNGWRTLIKHYRNTSELQQQYCTKQAIDAAHAVHAQLNQA